MEIAAFKSNQDEGREATKTPVQWVEEATAEGMATPNKKSKYLSWEFINLLE